MRTTIALLSTAALLVSVACNHENEPVRTVTTTGAGVVGNDDAVKRLTDARCDHVKACNDLGEGKKFADEAACKREYGHDLQSNFRAGECPRGIRQEKLGNCLQEIKNEKCGNLVDKISRSETCRTGVLCID